MGFFMPEDNPKRFKAVGRSPAKKSGHVSAEAEQNDDKPKFKAARRVKRVDKKKTLASGGTDIPSLAEDCFAAVVVATREPARGWASEEMIQNNLGEVC
jgi:hypothetical protein